MPKTKPMQTTRTNCCRCGSSMTVSLFRKGLPVTCPACIKNGAEGDNLPYTKLTAKQRSRMAAIVEREGRKEPGAPIPLTRYNGMVYHTEKA